MKKLVIISIILSLLMGLHLQCNPKPVEPDPEPSGQKKLFIPPFIATWMYSIPKIPNILEKPMQLRLSLDTNHTFKLIALENMEKTLFSSEGTWKSIPEITFDSIPAEAQGIIPDSVILIGEQCLFLDTSATPDTLAVMKDAECAAPISLGKPKTPETWTIRTASLKVALTTLPIKPEQVEMVMQVLETIDLARSTEN